MARRIIYIVLFLAVVGVLYLGYSNYDAKRDVLSGDVHSADGTSTKSSDRSDSGSAADTKSSSSGAIVYPTPAATPQAAAGQSTMTDQTGQAASGMTVPGSDSMSPNPPSGMAFAGTGKYQFYRQGNLTWRLNTETGQTCIIFATDEEWAKPKVMRAGCGSTR